MNALIIRKPWIDLILDGKKTWEIRSSNTHIRGEIELIQSSSGLVIGKCELVDSIQLDLKTYQSSSDKHCIMEELDKLPYKKTYAWAIRNPIRYEKPRPYKHPSGAVIWVKL